MSTLRKKVYNLLTPEAETSGLSRAIDLFLFVLIGANVLAVVVETVPWVARRHWLWLWRFELFSLGVFTVEYILRLWCAPEVSRFQGRRFPRLRYMLTPMALVDLIAIVPLYFMFFVRVDLRFVWVLRLLRIIKFTRYSTALSTLQQVLREEAGTFFAGIFILLVMLTLAASGAYLAEHAAQPEVFGSIPAAMWWAIVTLTTVGYGDASPVTTAGKIFGGLVAVIGVGIAALPAGIIANGLNIRLHRARDTLMEQYRSALRDGVIDPGEARRIEGLRKSLRLSRQDARQIEERVRNDLEHHLRTVHCPHCGQSFALAPPGKTAGHGPDA